MLPPVPTYADPELKAIEPLLPLVAEPVFIVMAPLVPAVPASEDRSVNEPLLQYQHQKIEV